MIWTEQEFEAVFRAIYPRLLRASGLLLGDQAAAEDVAQEAFARLLARAPLDSPDAERWVFRVARNLAVSRLRHDARQMPLAEVAEPPAATPGDEVGLRVEALRAAVMALPPKQREVVGLRVYGELSYEEIASAVGRSVGSVRQDLHRAKAALRETLNGLAIEDDDA